MVDQNDSFLNRLWFQIIQIIKGIPFAKIAVLFKFLADVAVVVGVGFAYH